MEEPFPNDLAASQRDLPCVPGQQRPTRSLQNEGINDQTGHSLDPITTTIRTLPNTTHWHTLTPPEMFMSAEMLDPSLSAFLATGGSAIDYQPNFMYDTSSRHSIPVDGLDNTWNVSPAGAAEAHGILSGSNAVPNFDTDAFNRYPEHSDSFYISIPYIPIMDQTSIPSAGPDAAVGSNIQASRIPSNSTSSSARPNPQSRTMRSVGLESVSNPVQVARPVFEKQKLLKKPTASKSDKITKKRPNNDLKQEFKACWRCKRYKKPCVGEGSVCDSCLTSGFRVWPSALGCRRGNMDNFIKIILPDGGEEILSNLTTVYVKPVPWRRDPNLQDWALTVSSIAAQGDIWDKVRLKVQSTGVHGPGIIDLIEIGANHQRMKRRGDNCMTAAAIATVLTGDWFCASFSTGPEAENFDPSGQFSELYRKTRKAISIAVDHVLRGCLVGKLKDWFPTFVAGVILVFDFIIIADIIMAIPSSHREKIWKDVQHCVIELRHYLYLTARDLFVILAKGGNLLDMKHWEMVSDDEKPGSRKRNPEGMRILDGDENTFDAMRELQLWREQYSVYLSDDSWFGNRPFTVKMYPVMGLARMFKPVSGT